MFAVCDDVLLSKPCGSLSLHTFESMLTEISRLEDMDFDKLQEISDEEYRPLLAAVAFTILFYLSRGKK